MTSKPAIYKHCL